MHRLRALTVLALLLTTGLTGCVGPGDEPADVLTTLYPLTFAAQHLAGDALTVRSLLGTDQQAHGWEPTLADVQDLRQARLLIVQGAGMEPWLDRVLESLGDNAPPVIVASRGLPLIGGDESDVHDDHEETDDHDDATGHDSEQDTTGTDTNHTDENATRDVHDEGTDHDEAAGHGEEGGHDEDDHGDVDPHTWLDPVLFAEQVRVIAAGLRVHFPDHASAIVDREDDLVGRLGLLHQEYTAALLDCRTRLIIVNHNAFAYLARQYKMEVEAVHGLSPEGEPSAAAVRRVIDLAREHDVGIVFFEDMASPRTIQTVAREAGTEARVLYTLAGRTTEQVVMDKDYLTLMRANLENIAEAMGCT